MAISYLSEKGINPLLYAKLQVKAIAMTDLQKSIFIRISGRLEYWHGQKIIAINHLLAFSLKALSLRVNVEQNNSIILING